MNILFVSLFLAEIISIEPKLKNQGKRTVWDFKCNTFFNSMCQNDLPLRIKNELKMFLMLLKLHYEFYYNIYLWSKR